MVQKRNRKNPHEPHIFKKDPFRQIIPYPAFSFSPASSLLSELSSERASLKSSLPYAF